MNPLNLKSWEQDTHERQVNTFLDRYGKRFPRTNITVLREVLLSFSYKPNGMLHIVDGADAGSIIIEVSLKTWNAKRPEDISFINNGRIFYPEEFLSKELLELKLYDICVSLELHEIDEWLKFDGINYRNPHPE